MCKLLVLLRDIQQNVQYSHNFLTRKTDLKLKPVKKNHLINQFNVLNNYNIFISNVIK